MSYTIDDGGPAFPTLPLTGALGSKIQKPSSGLSMRDYFAGQALSGCIAGKIIEAILASIPAMMAGIDADIVIKEAANKVTPLVITKDAFEIADAMLSARKGAQP